MFFVFIRPLGPFIRLWKEQGSSLFPLLLPPMPLSYLTLTELRPGKSSGQVSYLMAFVKDVRAKSIRNGRRDDLMNQIGFIRAAHSDKRNY